MDMKRSRDQFEVQNLEMAQCLVLLSNANYYSTNTFMHATKFECKTCNKNFSSFQALGGHRASHKRQKPSTIKKSGNDDRSSDESAITGSLVAKKPKKMHQCSMCGLQFSVGQALGGHMRRHRASMVDGYVGPVAPPAVNAVISKLPVLRRSGSYNRVFGLDLNLSPLENDLAYLFAKMAPRANTLL